MGKWTSGFAGTLCGLWWSPRLTALFWGLFKQVKTRAAQASDNSYRVLSGYI